MIAATITSKNEQVVLTSLASLDERIMQAAHTGLASGLEEVVGIVRLEFLSGSPLRRVTGRLQSGMTQSVTRAGAVLFGRVGNAVKYAAYHEFGFHGTVNVRAHSRVMDQVNAKGQSMPATPGKVISGVLQTRKESAKRQRGGFVMVQFVKAHSRKVNYAGKPFVRPALERHSPKIAENINKSVALVK